MYVHTSLRIIKHNENSKYPTASNFNLMIFMRRESFLNKVMLRETRYWPIIDPIKYCL